MVICFDDCVGDDDDDVFWVRCSDIHVGVSILYLVLDGYRVHWLRNIFTIVHFSSWLVHDDFMVIIYINYSHCYISLYSTSM